MTDALILAKNAGVDTFNALDLMDNEKFLMPLKFGAGDANLWYYIYNYSLWGLHPRDLAVVLL
jgi:glycylpeptide N-tetradecanoyltransferase